MDSQIVCLILQRITSIAVHPPSSQLCYTALVASKSQGEVSCVWMDGRNQAVLWAKSALPMSVVFSDNGTTLYWADTGFALIPIYPAASFGWLCFLD